MQDSGTVDIGDRPDGDARLAEVMAEAARSINAPEALEDVLDRLAHAACTAIPGVDYAGVSIARHTGIETMSIQVSGC